MLQVQRCHASVISLVVQRLDYEKEWHILTNMHTKVLSCVLYSMETESKVSRSWS